MRRIILIIHNVRSLHNVGSILRSADGFAVDTVYLTGYTPYPKARDDQRLPHLAQRADKQISKTSLGAEKTVKWKHRTDVFKLLTDLKKEGFQILCLEQTKKAASLPKSHFTNKVVLIVGSEIDGIEKRIIDEVHEHIEIPMLGQKESLNVAVATAVALYHLRWYNHFSDDR